MTNISHEQARDYMLRGRDDLNAAEQSATDEHLRNCADCSAYADEIGVVQVNIQRALHHRWDRVQPSAETSSQVVARLSRHKFPQRALGFAMGLAALVALVLLLRAFFTAQTQVKTAQSPLATLPARAATSAAPAPATVVNAAAVTRPTPTPPSGQDFYRLQRLTYTPSGAFRPAVSPDGQRVAYASERNGNWDVYVLNRSAGVEMRLTDDALPDMAPSWSPDGTRIAYQHNKLSDAGPVLVDYMVMNADGSNKIVASSGTPWLKNEAPQWSPAGDRLAFSGGDGIYVITLDDRHETTIIKRTDQHVYASPAWVDGQHLVYVADGQVMSGDVTGNNQMVMQLTDPAQIVMAQPPYIVYVQQQGATTRVNHAGLDEIPLTTWAVFPAGSIEHAALSPDGQLAAIQTDSAVVVAAAGLPSAWQQAPLFTINNNLAPSDLLSVAWLPDSSGFVFVSAQDGQPDLYLARLNQPAIDYVKAQGQTVAQPTPAPTATFGPLLTPTPYEPSVVTPITNRDVAIRLALQADSNTVQRDQPVTMDMVAVDPNLITVQRFTSQVESGFGVNATIVDGPVWVVTIHSRGVLSLPGFWGEVDEVSYSFLERTGTLLGIGNPQRVVTPTPTPLLGFTPFPETLLPEQSATPTALPLPETPTPYMTPRYETPTPQLTLTPATPTPTSSVPTSTPTPLVPVTPEAGLVIRGLVQQSDGTRLGNVKIYRAFASYPGEVVATTDPAGYYQSQFQPIPGDEMVRVWAELPGYTFGPADTTVAWTAGAYAWRHYHGYWETILNFTAQAAP